MMHAHGDDGDNDNVGVRWLENNLENLEDDVSAIRDRLRIFERAVLRQGVTLVELELSLETANEYILLQDIP